MTAHRSGRRGGGRLLWVAAVGLTIALQWNWLVLYLDLRYTFGALRTGAQHALPATDVFLHRPMANRLLMAGLDRVTFGTTVLRERLTLSLAVVLAGLAAAGLAGVLRRWVSATTATGIGLATFGALAWAPAVAVLQPEWTAALLCVSALAAGLARPPRRAVSWRSPLLATAGLLLAVGALQKYTTATTVAVALGLLFTLCRRRAWFVAGWTAVLTAALLGLTLLNEHERQWFRDMPRLNPSGNLDGQALARSLGNLLWLNPVLLLWPAAVLLGLRVFGRRTWLIGNLLALVVLMAGVIVQNSFFPYHYAALPVLAAALVALAGGQWWQRTGRLPWLVLVGLAWVPVAGWLARRPAGWRETHADWAVVSVVLVAAVAAGLTCWQLRVVGAGVPRPPRSAAHLLVTVPVVALLASFPAWPHTPYASFPAHATRASEVAGRDRSVEVGRALRESAGGATVVYLARQDAPYFVALPTGCPYPTATFLYRSARTTDPADVVSFQENLACLRDPDAGFLLLQPAMIDPSRAVPLVRDTVAAEFDCEHPTARAGSFLLCPRR